MPLNTIPNTGLTSRGYPSDRLVTPIIINGDMSVAQRGTSATGITSTSYNTVDRFRVGVSGFGTWTQSQDTDVPTGEGFAKSLKMDCTTASGPDAAGSVLYHVQYVEAQNLQMLKFGTSNAEYITLAFWVKTNITGTYTVEIESPDSGRHICGTYTVNSSNTWEKKILSFPGDTTGSITNDNGRGFEIFWWLGAGSEFTSGTLATSWASQTAGNRVSSSQANIASSTDNNFWITGVQLEVGEFDSTTIPSFPFESYANSLEKCQRYYFEEGNNAQSFVAGAFNASASPFRYTFMKPMRAAPSGSIGGSINTDLKLYSAGSDKTLTGVSFAAITTHGARVEIDSSGAFTAGQTGHVYLLNNTGKLKFDAEL